MGDVAFVNKKGVNRNAIRRSGDRGSNPAAGIAWAPASAYSAVAGCGRSSRPPLGRLNLTAALAEARSPAAAERAVHALHERRVIQVVSGSWAPQRSHSTAGVNKEVSNLAAAERRTNKRHTHVHVM